jgi:hypothetical protein
MFFEFVLEIRFGFLERFFVCSGFGRLAMDWKGGWRTPIGFEILFLFTTYLLSNPKVTQKTALKFKFELFEHFQKK